MAEEEQFDEFDDGEDEDADELEEATKDEVEEKPKAATTKKGEMQKKPVGRPKAEEVKPQAEVQAQEPQIIQVPRAVSKEEMLNNIADAITAMHLEMRQSLNAIYAKIK